MSIPDFLISNRITVCNTYVHVNYYTPSDIKETMGFFKRLFTDTFAICEMANQKNRELHEQASEIAREKKMKPLFPPNVYKAG